MVIRLSYKIVGFVALIVLCDMIMLPAFSGVSGSAHAEPPPWAPAHGWRAKHHDDDENDDEDHRDYQQPRLVEAAPMPLIASYPYVQVSCSNKPILGAVIGGTAGGLIGNQFGKGNGNTAATIGGVLLGAVFGHNVGVNLSQQDAGCMAQALEYGRQGTQVTWQTPSQNAAYSVLPLHNFKNDEGEYCREYQAHVRIEGKIRNSYGKACRQPDGEWKIVQ